MTLHQLSSIEFGTVAPNSVLVAVDLSRTSLRAADYAAGMARRTGVGVVGVYVRKNNALLEWLDFPPNGETPVAANCPGMAGGYLEITPPNTTVSSRFDPPGDMCQQIQIHPVVPGDSGRSGT